MAWMTARAFVRAGRRGWAGTGPPYATGRPPDGMNTLRLFDDLIRFFG